MSDPIIQVRGLTKKYEHLWALRGVDFELEAGEFLALFGPNGAGKTTLLRILATLTRPNAGKVSICGYDAGENAEDLRRQLGVVSHNTFLYGSLSAEENLRFYAALHGLGEARSRIAEILDLVGLGPRRRDFVRTFSRGMQQRLALARALVHNPQILLFDEPYTGLDPISSARLSKLLSDLRQERHTVFMITHDLGRGLELATQAAILVAGRIVYHQPVAGMGLTEFSGLYSQVVAENTNSPTMRRAKKLLV